jgi:hypothetical protein
MVGRMEALTDWRMEFTSVEIEVVVIARPDLEELKCDMCEMVHSTWVYSLPPVSRTFIHRESGGTACLLCIACPTDVLASHDSPNKNGCNLNQSFR